MVLFSFISLFFVLDIYYIDDVDAARVGGLASAYNVAGRVYKQTHSHKLKCHLLII